MSDQTTFATPTGLAGSFSGTLTHSQVYHVQCGRCGAATVRDVNHDTVRMMCPSCNRRLTLPATVNVTCPVCRADSEYPHTLAGHSTSCASCNRPVLLGPVIGGAESHRQGSSHHHHTSHGHSNVRHHHHKRPKRTLAFSEGGERSLVLIVAAIATLIFIVVASLH